MAMGWQHKQGRQPGPQVDPLLVVVFDQIDGSNRLVQLEGQQRKRNRLFMSRLPEELRNRFGRELSLTCPELVVDPTGDCWKMFGNLEEISDLSRHRTSRVAPMESSLPGASALSQARSSLHQSV